MTDTNNSTPVSFEQNPHGSNELAYGDGFFVSFNPCPWDGLSPFSADDGGSETALVFNESYLILNGDHRTKYLDLIPQGIEACVAYFRSLPDQHSSWCSGPESRHD